MSTSDYIKQRLKAAEGLSRPIGERNTDPDVWYGEGKPTRWAIDKYLEWLGSGNSVSITAARRIMDTLNADATGRRSSGARRVRPSMIGGCVRAQALSFLGVPQSESRAPSGYSMAVSGTWGHYRWQAAGLSAGFFTDIEVEVRSEGLGISGQVDAVCSDGAVFELKTVGSHIFKPWKGRTGVSDQPRLKDVKQVHAYMRLLNCDTARIVYEDRGNADLVEWTIGFDEGVWESVAADTEKVLGSTPTALPRPLPDCVQEQGNDYKYCDWSTVCRPQGPPWDDAYAEEVMGR